MSDVPAKLIIRRRWRSREIERLASPLFNDALTPQAIAGYERSGRAREARHRKAWGFLAEVVEAPLRPTLDEHRSLQREAAIARWHAARKACADEWRAARARLRRIERDRAIDLVAEWNGGQPDARKGSADLISFLSQREPDPELLETRRQARLGRARRHIEFARRNFTWYVAHRACPEGELGAAEAVLAGSRGIHCIACEHVWRTRSELAAAERAGELVIVDYRLAEQMQLL